MVGTKISFRVPHSAPSEMVLAHTTGWILCHPVLWICGADRPQPLLGAELVAQSAVEPSASLVHIWYGVIRTCNHICRLVQHRRDRASGCAGYSMSIFIPVSFLCVFPYEALRWPLVVLATATSGCFLVLNFKSYIMEHAGNRYHWFMLAKTVR